MIDDALARALATTCARHSGVSPGGQLSVCWGDGPQVDLAFGELAPGESAVTPAHWYDLASLTKPLTAVAIARAAARRGVTLDAPVTEVLPQLGADFSTVTPRLLLSHRAGLAAWAPLYTQLHAASLGALIAAQGCAPSAASRYSDLGYLLAGLWADRVFQRDAAERIADEVTGPLGLAELAMRPLDHGVSLGAIAPTERCEWRGRVVRGEVHDENAAALGGVAAHAGLFGTARAYARLGAALCEAWHRRSHWLDGAILHEMLVAQAGGTHRVGFDTPNAEGASCGRAFGPASFGHLGFTGTSLWVDPTRRLVVVLVTNRVHPSRENTAIRAFRPALHDAVVAALEDL